MNLQEKDKQLHQTVDKGYEQTLCKRRHLCSQQTYKNAYHHCSLQKCKSKPHSDATSCQLEWQSLKNLEITDAGDNVEK